MKINIVSPGRFHVCDLARELARNGHDVKFYSFVPTKRAMKFGLPKECSASLILPMAPFLVLSKKIFPKSGWATKLTTLFQDWLTSVVMRKCDVCHEWKSYQGIQKAWMRTFAARSEVAVG